MPFFCHSIGETPADFFVSTTGNNSNDGLTKGTAKLTWDGVLPLLSTSTEIVEFADGTYNPSSAGIEPPANTTVRAENRHGAIFVGGGVTEEGILFASANNVTFDGLIVRDPTGFDVAAASLGAPNATLKNCILTNSSDNSTNIGVVRCGGFDNTNMLIDNCGITGKARSCILATISHDLTISNCILRKDQQTTESEPVTVLMLYGSEGATLTNNVLIDAEITGKITENGYFMMEQDWLGPGERFPYPVEVFDLTVNKMCLFNADTTPTLRAVFGSNKGGDDNRNIVFEDFYIKNFSTGASFTSGNEWETETTLPTRNTQVNVTSASPAWSSLDWPASTGDAVIDWSDLVNETAIRTEFANSRASGWTTHGGTLENYITGV